jgi:hypothetical protein
MVICNNCTGHGIISCTSCRHTGLVSSYEKATIKEDFRHLRQKNIYSKKIPLTFPSLKLASNIPFKKIWEYQDSLLPPDLFKNESTDFQNAFTNLLKNASSPKDINVYPKSSLKYQKIEVSKVEMLIVDYFFLGAAYKVLIIPEVKLLLHEKDPINDYCNHLYSKAEKYFYDKKYNSSNNILKQIEQLGSKYQDTKTNSLRLNVDEKRTWFYRFSKIFKKNE